MTTAEIIRPSDTNSIKGIAPHFYRPELDALRFLAFLAVYVCHSIPNAWVADASRTGSRTSIQALAAVKDAGNFGVCLFFLLSAFLITELLRREYEVYGSIHASAFYLRRILRIWPLYFGITIAYVIGGHFFPALRLEPGRVVAYFLLAGNWYIALHPWIQTPLRALWSISVEEQFYLAWPLVAKFRGMGGLIAASLTIVPMSLLTIYITSANEPYAYTRVWLNSLTQFQFFAWGAMLALALNGLRLKLNSVLRAAMALVGSSFWLLAAAVAQIKRPGVRITPPQACFGYVLIAAGCIFLFLAVFGVSTHRVPRWVVYLGKISFGLYVSHETAFLFMDEAQKHAENLLPVFGAWASQHLVLILTINKIAALFVTIVLAAISYRFWESPFLRLRRRFTFIESRGV